jgi:hypothetical protein
MDYYSAYDRYCANWLTVERFRRKNFIYKHLLSLPYQWAKRYCAKRAIHLLGEEKNFPVLHKSGNPEIIVSLTSFPFRISSLHLVVKSLLRQEMLPGKILICLAKDEFPKGLDSLPAELKQLIPHGIEIVFTENNLRSHNKYFTAFQRFPDKIVITVDDDFLYQKDTISRLMRLHRLFPSAVCANRVWTVGMQNGEFTTCKKWARLIPEQDSESAEYVALGWTGVLYPPHIFDNTIFDAELLQRIAPLADDLWLKAVQLKNGVKVAVAKGFFVHPIELSHTQKISLNHLNDKQHKNDEQWRQLDEHFGLKKLVMS